MTEERDIALIDELRAQPAELSWLEFKRNQFTPKTIGTLCSAIANAAAVEGEKSGYIVWGIANATHDVVGTDFCPDREKANGQELRLWLVQRLRPSVLLTFREVNHPDGRVVILEIATATTVPVAFDNILYIRIGSTTPKLTDYPDYHQKLIDCLRPYTWEKAIARQYVSEEEVLELLDYEQYFNLTQQTAPDSCSGILAHLEADQIIKKDVGKRWDITNLGAILFATDLNKFDSSLARKAVRFVVYNGKDKSAQVIDRKDGKRGYAAGFQSLVNYINSKISTSERIGPSMRELISLFPVRAVRELVANALIHQDMTITGAGPQIELFEDRIEINNPGTPLMSVERMIDFPPRSRNEALASLMRRIGFCEEQGSGLDQVIFDVELHQLPPPLLRATKHSTQVVLYGPRTFAQMTLDERIRACYFHAVLKFIKGERMKNASLCKRFGVAPRNAAQVSYILKKSVEAGAIKVVDPDHPRAGYVPIWA